MRHQGITGKRSAAQAVWKPGREETVVWRMLPIRPGLAPGVLCMEPNLSESTDNMQAGAAAV